VHVLPDIVYDDVVYDDEGDCLMEETTSPTSTAPSPTRATLPIVVDDNQGLDGCLRRVLGLLEDGVRDFAWAGRRKERDEEDNTNPIDLRLVVSWVLATTTERGELTLEGRNRLELAQRRILDLMEHHRE